MQKYCFMNNFAVKSTKCGKSLWSVYEGLAFQSTPPRGRRPLVELGTLNGFTISIHASAREATVLHCDNADCPANFNPHLREGGDAAIRSDSKSPPPFQSTPPRGRRPFCHIRFPPFAYFNPRLREGGDTGTI